MMKSILYNELVHLVKRIAAHTISEIVFYQHLKFDTG